MSVQRKKVDPRRQFALDVVRSAVALPIADQQDRLRVLTAAAQVAAPLSRPLEEEYARAGARVEADLIAHGERPAVSMLGSGYIDCSTAAEFVEAVPAAQVPLAEQSLVGIVSACPRQGLQAVRLKLESALDQGVLAARALLATMQRIGTKSAWAQAEFVKVFSSLSPDLADARPEVPYYAALFVRMAPNVERDAARRAGLKLLEWLAKLDDSGERRLAVNLVTNAMRQVLGQKAYDDALSGDVVARDIAATSGQPVLLQRPFEGSVSVLAAMADPKDRIASLSALPATLCAREAAAHGFASGIAGHTEQASRYFDLAFSAADDVWSARNQHAAHSATEGGEADAVIQEVSEAAAQVDPVAALRRAQAFSDPAAEAIGMLAVARVVLSGQRSLASLQHTAQP